MQRVVFYGNCQALALHKIYSAHVAPWLASSSYFIDSFQKLSESARAELARADFLVAQVVTPKSLAALDELPCSAPRLTFPALAGLFLWPFGSQSHPLNPIVGGPYPAELGDSYLNRKIKQDADVEATVAAYVEADVNQLRNLDRLLEMTLEQQRVRDELCGFSFAPFVADNFRTQRLFLSPGHPTLGLTRLWSLQILRRFVAQSELLDRAERNLTANPFPHSELPIHPAVIRHFGLTFLPDAPTYTYAHEGRLSFVDFARRYMRYEWNRDLENGLGLIQAGQREAATAKLLAALQASPGSARAHAELGFLLAEAGQPDAALDHARAAVRLAPDDAHAQARLAHVLAKAAQPDAAVGAAAAAAAAEAALRRAIDLDAGNPVLHNTLSRRLMQQRRHAEALEPARRAAELRPQDAGLRSHVAALLLRLQRPAEAEAEARAALLLSPEHPGLLGNLSHALAHQHKQAEALEIARRVVAMTPDDAGSRAHAAFLLLRQNCPDEAEAELRAGIALAPERASLHEMLARALERQGRLEEAIAAAHRALGLQDDNPHWQGLLGQLLERAGRLADAETAMARAVALAPGETGWPRRLAAIRARQAAAVLPARADLPPPEPTIQTRPAAAPEAAPQRAAGEGVYGRTIEPDGSGRGGRMAGLLRWLRNPGASMSSDQPR